MAEAVAGARGGGRQELGAVDGQGLLWGYSGATLALLWGYSGARVGLLWGYAGVTLGLE